jgi:hypothetical protein
MTAPSNPIKKVVVAENIFPPARGAVRRWVSTKGKNTSSNYKAKQASKVDMQKEFKASERGYSAKIVEL